MDLISMLSANQLVATTPTPAINENRYFFIIKSPFITKSFLKPCAREGEHPKAHGRIRDGIARQLDQRSSLNYSCKRLATGRRRLARKYVRLSGVVGAPTRRHDAERSARDGLCTAGGMLLAASLERPARACAITAARE